MDKHIIFGVHITDRLKKAVEVQQLLTQYGMHIKTRLGLHEVNNSSSPNGILLLEMHGDEAVCFELAEKLEKIDGVDVQKMIFDH